MRKAAAILAPAFLVASLGAACAESIPLDAEKYWDANCARCHRSVGRVMNTFDGLPDEITRTELLDLLATHHPPDQEIKKTLVDWMMLQSG